MPQLSIDTQRFSEEFLALAREKRTGTYKVVCADGMERYLLFQEGSIIDIDTREEDSLLTAAVLGTGRVGEREARKARKAKAKRTEPLGAIILETVAIPEEELVAAVRAAIADAICALFTTSLRSADFIEHAADERLEDFRGELSEVLEIRADPEDLLLEAASRLDRWEIVERGFSLLRDVYYATPDAFRYFQDEARYAHEVAVIGRIDGRNDFAEVVEASVEQSGGTLDPFRAFGIIRALAARGEVQPLNPVQLFQLGVEYHGQGNHAKALKLLNRASERGLDDFDISFKIAETLEAIGKRPEAAARYREFGEKCLAQFRPEDAIKSYLKAAELEPQNLAWQRKLLELFIHENRRDEAVALALEIAARMEAARDVRGALHLLLDLRRRDIKSDRVGQRIIELAEKCGDQAAIRAERERLASDYHSQKDVEKALAMYQQMYCDGNGSPEVRLKLIELHHQKGNHAAVIEHITALFCLPESERLKEIAVLKRLHELVCEIKPGELRSHRWLVDYHLRAGTRDQAVALLKGLAAHLEREGDPREAVRVLRQLVAAEPGSLEHRWRMVKAVEKAGKPSELIEHLRALVACARERKEPREAERGCLEILKASPFDLDSRKTLADLCEAQGEGARAAGYVREVVYLDTLAGSFKEAQAYARRLLAAEPGDPEMVRRFGDLCRALGDDQEGIQELVKSARLHLERRNLGIARDAVAHALQLKPSNPEAQELLRAVEEIEAQLSGKRSAEAAPAKAEAPAEPAASAPLAAGTVKRPGREADVAFQPSAPVIQKGVAGITARLKTMKSGGGPTPAAAAASPGQAPAGDAAPAAPSEPHPPTPAVKAKSGAVLSAASKLKALASGVAAKPAAAAPSPPGEEPPAAAGPEAAAEPVPAETQPEGIPPEATPVHVDAEKLEQLRAALQDGGSAPAGAAPAAAPKGKSKPIGKSAALLSKLRKRSAADKDKIEQEELEAEKELG